MELSRILNTLVTRKILNNVAINLIIVNLGLEKWIKKYVHPYKAFQVSESVSLQEISGFSNRPEINDTLEKIHSKYQRIVARFVKPRGKILDIGCGPGLYLKDFESKFEIYGIDMSDFMLKQAKRNLNEATLYQGDFLNFDFQNLGFDMILSTSMLEYISRSDLEFFLSKVSFLLKPHGIFAMNYPHALSISDLFYKDLMYIQYSPKLIERLLSKCLKIIEHKHVIDDRIIGLYDHKPYRSLKLNDKRTCRNSSIIICQKK